MNEHIKNYCEKFIESEENPLYAVFINGKWGTGKTYFINNLLEKYSKDTVVKDNEIIKISLFGVKTTDEIDMKIYQAIHPFLSSKNVKLLGSVLRSAIKLGTSLDFNGDNKDDFSISSDGLLEIKSGDKVSKIAKKLLIVDDFERALLSPEEIFGYFSEIITDSSTKVIFIGNEEKIFNEDEKKKNDYFKIKEKTIGIEFEIKPDKEKAIDDFISKLSFGDKDFFKNKVNEISNFLECDNLRTIWQALYNLNLFVNLIEDELEDDDKEIIFEIFLILYLQKNMGEIQEKDDISLILTGYYKYHLSYSNYKKKIDEQKENNKYYFPEQLKNIPLVHAWKKIIFEGYYIQNELRAVYREEKENQRQQQKKIQQTNLFTLINNWRALSKEEFQPLVKNVIDDLNSGKYLHPGEILLFANYMILFSKWELIPNSTNEIYEMIKNTLDAYKDSIYPIEDWMFLDMGYGGYGFTSDLPEFNAIKKQVKNFNAENIETHLKRDIEKEIQNIESNVDNFIKNIIHVNGNNKYYKHPVLSYMNINDFYYKLKSLSVSEQERIIAGFSERYGKEYSKEPFMSEYSNDLDNLKKLKDLYESNLGEIEYNPQALFEKNISKELEELIEYIERKIKDSR